MIGFKFRHIFIHCRVLSELLYDRGMGWGEVSKAKSITLLIINSFFCFCYIKMVMIKVRVACVSTTKMCFRLGLLLLSLAKQDLQKESTT